MDLKEKFNIAANIKQLRKVQNITLIDLQKKTNIEINTLKNYENFLLPSIKNLIKISSFFGVSIDFLLLGNNTKYPQNIYLISLAQKIDSLDQFKRFQIESTANSLIGKKDNNIQVKTDNFDLLLTDNIHENIKTLRKYKKFSQKQIAKYLNIHPTSIYSYEKKSIPPAIKLFKIAEFLDVSVHSIATGKKLQFNFTNNHLLNIMLKADKFLTLQEKYFFIHLMQRIIEDSE
jgi:transcriptional regulator with XRE-family HTH domain